MCLCCRISPSETDTSVLGGVSAAASGVSKTDEYRLPTNVVPTHYDLAFKTDLASSPPTFAGEALIDLEVKEDSSSLTFNIHESLKITHLAISAAELKTSAAVHISL